MFSLEEINSAKKTIEELLNKYPKLNENGWAEASFYSRTKEEHEEGKQTMIDKADVFLTVCDWLKNINKIKTINKLNTSYGLKHMVERHMKRTRTGDHVPNGIFIAAAIFSGFKYQECKKKTCQNLFFNMSKKSLKSINKLK